jgi:hypothetical protein
MILPLSIEQTLELFYGRASFATEIEGMKCTVDGLSEISLKGTFGNLFKPTS